MNKTVIHIAECRLNPNGGMGRVAWHWKAAFEENGYHFLHIGLDEVGQLKHPSKFPSAALQYYQSVESSADVLLVHEPSSGAFIRFKDKVIVVSHGLERRFWNVLKNGHEDIERVRLKTRLLYPIWRLRGSEKGLRSARALLLINEEDRTYAIDHYRRSGDSIFVFKNGVDDVSNTAVTPKKDILTILFLGSWIDRKGTRTLVRAANLLHSRQISVKWVLAGTGVSKVQVLQQWPEDLKEYTQVLPSFAPNNEESLQAEADIFVLPSFFEGQPLSLLQAMALGKCCITTNTCGQRDLIRHRENGLLFQAGDALEFAKLIEETVKKNVLRSELGQAARLTVADRAWPATSHEVVRFVERMMAH